MRWGVAGAVGLAAMAAVAVTTHEAKAVDYVKVCDLYGAGFFYIPGTQICYNAVTGETRWETSKGAQRSLNRVDLAYQGTAVAMAMPTPVIEYGKTFAIAGNFGQYSSTKAFGLAGAFEVSPGLSFNGGISVGADQQTVGSKVGFNYSW